MGGLESVRIMMMLVMMMTMMVMMMLMMMLMGKHLILTSKV